MSVRKFKLINANGVEWDLMRKDAFLYEPSGMGIAKDGSYMRIGTSYENIDMVQAQRTLSGTMVFKTYAVYEQFAAFLNYTPLKIAYMPRSTWAYMDGEITNLEKTEIDKDTHRLLCSMTFTGTSMWYIPKKAVRTADDVVGAKRYNYIYDYVYADQINGYINVTNNSSESAPAKISIFGTITNPAWYMSVNGNVITSGSITATIPSGNKLVVNSKDGNLELAEYTTANVFVKNHYQNSDFSKVTFIRFPPGNSVLYVSGDSVDPIEAWVEIEELHETV